MKKSKKILHIPVKSKRSVIPKNEVFGGLTVLDYHSTSVTQNQENGRRHYVVYVMCECHCGNKVVKSLKILKERRGLSCDNIQCKRDWWKTKKLLKEEK